MKVQGAHPGPRRAAQAAAAGARRTCGSSSAACESRARAVRQPAAGSVATSQAITLGGQTNGQAEVRGLAANARSTGSPQSELCRWMVPSRRVQATVLRACGVRAHDTWLCLQIAGIVRPARSAAAAMFGLRAVAPAEQSEQAGWSRVRIRHTQARGATSCTARD